MWLNFLVNWYFDNFNLKVGIMKCELRLWVSANSYYIIIEYFLLFFISSNKIVIYNNHKNDLTECYVMIK